MNQNIRASSLLYNLNMDWLRPDKIQPSYDPEEVVKHFIQQNGKMAGIILTVFDNVDPLRVNYGINSDEYLGYVGKFMKQLRGRNLKELSVEEIENIVRQSFHPGQIEKGFVEEQSIKDMAVIIKNESIENE